MRLNWALAVYLATLVAAQDFTIDPSQVSASDKAAWCASELNSCKLLCDNNPATNDCTPSSLTYHCTCSNGDSPPLDQYTKTLPTFICNEAFKQCVNANVGNAVGQKNCTDSIQSKCGTKDPASGSNSSPAGASTQSSPSNEPTGSGKSSSPSATPSPSSKTLSSSSSSSTSSTGPGNPSNTAEGGSTTTSTSGDNNNNNGNSGGEGLSTPAKAGIGIGVAVGMLLIAGNLGYCIWHYRKNRTPKPPPEYRYPGVPELGGNPRSELGGREMKMANSNPGMTQWAGPPRELDAPAEMSPQARNVELEAGYPR